MNGSAGVGASGRPHAPSRAYHILQYIHILYTDYFLGFFYFFCEVFIDFFLITSLQERGRAAPTRWRYCNMYSAIYMGENDEMIA